MVFGRMAACAAAAARRGHDAPPLSASAHVAASLFIVVHDLGMLPFSLCICAGWPGCMWLLFAHHVRVRIRL